MSTTTKVTCDGNKCHNYFYPDESMEEYELDMLSENGWALRDTFHYCGTCTPLVDQEAKEEAEHETNND